MITEQPLGIDSVLVAAVAIVLGLQQRPVCQVALAAIRTGDLLAVVGTHIDDHRAATERSTRVGIGGICILDVAGIGYRRAIRIFDALGALERASTNECRQSEVIGEITRVLQHVVLATLRVEQLAAIAAAIQLAHGLVVDRAGRLLLVRECGQFQQVVLVDVPVELQQPSGILDGAIAVGERIGWPPGRVIVLPVRHQSVREQAILDQRAAGPDIGPHQIHFVLRIVLLDRADVGRHHGIGVRRRRIFFAKRIRRPVDVRPPLEFVGAAFGDLVDHATQRSAELSAVATGLDLLLGDALERHLREIEAAERVGHVEAVDVVLILGDG